MEADKSVRDDHAIDEGSSGHRREVFEVFKSDLRRCRRIALPWVVSGILTLVLGVTALGFLVLSDAFGVETSTGGFVALVTVNAAWMFGALFALVGLFVAYPAHQWSDGRRMISQSLPHLVGVMLSRWTTVCGASLVAFIVPLVVMGFAFDDVRVTILAGFAVLTAVVLCAYVSIGIGFAVLTRSDGQLVLSLLAGFWIVTFLWETSILPLLVAISITGDPEGTIGTPPAIHDSLLAASPGGAMWRLSDVLLGESIRYVDFVAGGSLVWWVVLFPLVAFVIVASVSRVAE